MNKHLRSAVLLPAVCFISTLSWSQSGLAPDQNPDYAISRSKYMKIADSINAWHSTTKQDTYKAIDWLADRKEARADRRAFRRQLRLEQARWYGYNDYPPYGYYPGNHYSYYRNHYRRYRSYDYWWGFNFLFP